LYMAITEEVRPSETNMPPLAEKHFDGLIVPCYGGISGYTKAERLQSGMDSAHLSRRGLVGNIQLAQADQQAKGDYDPTEEQLRADIAKRGETVASNPACDKRPQSSDVAPIKNTCGVDLQTRVPQAEKSVVQVYNPDLGLGNGVYACKSDGSF